ncbi:MAG: diguanylate cyclase [Sulfuricella sp.]
MHAMNLQLSKVFRFRFMRNLVLIALAVLLVFPLHFYLFELPQYRSLIIQGAGDDSVHVARHVAGFLFESKTPFSAENMSSNFTGHVSEMGRDFGLYKLKVFGPDGKVLHSTDPREIGSVNRYEYFRHRVAAGEVATFMVSKQGISADGQVVSRDVVETYVPVMHNGKFLGAIEVYYDVTTQKADFDALVERSVLVALLLGGSLMLLAIAALLKLERDMRAREAVQQSLAEREALLDNLTTAASDAVIILDGQGCVVFWNLAAESMLGYAAEEVVGREFHRLIIPERFRADYQRGLDEFSATGSWPILGRALELGATHKDGHEVQVEMSVAAVKHAGAWHAIAILRDIGERKRMERQLQMGSRVISYAYEAIMVTDGDCKIEMVNPAFSEITGFPAAEVLGRNPSLLRSGRHDEAFFAALWREISEKGVWQGEIWNRRKDGELFPALLSISTVRNGGGSVQNYIGIFSDITRAKESEQRLERLAFHDALTGLANRLLFLDRLRQAIHQARRSKEKLAVMFLDLDGFKAVNDTFGHRVGDTLLQQVAGRIQHLLREQDTVARLGGDEFTVLVQSVSHSAEARGIAEKIRAALARPFEAEGQVCNVGVSIGISCYPHDGDSAGILVERADAAMYQAKQEGRNRFCFASPKGCGDDDGAGV